MGRREWGDTPAPRGGPRAERPPAGLPSVLRHRSSGRGGTHSPIIRSELKPLPIDEAALSVTVLWSMSSLSVLFFEEVKDWGLEGWDQEARDAEMCLPTPRRKCCHRTSMLTRCHWLLFTLFYFCVCPLTAGENISSNYAPQHTSHSPPEKGIWNPIRQKEAVKTVGWIILDQRKGDFPLPASWRLGKLGHSAPALRSGAASPARWWQVPESGVIWWGRGCRYRPLKPVCTCTAPVPPSVPCP